MKSMMICAILVLTSCGLIVSKEYAWTQSEDGIGMKAPINYRVRLEFSGDTEKWLQDARDANGVESRYQTNYVTNAPGSHCERFDASTNRPQ